MGIVQCLYLLRPHTLTSHAHLLTHAGYARLQLSKVFKKSNWERLYNMQKYTLKITETEANILFSLTTDTILAQVLRKLMMLRALMNMTNRLEKQVDWNTSTPILLTKQGERNELLIHYTPFIY